jgi:NADP-dependent 3-hydroxy acid dehydrogenase YdfG
MSEKSENREAERQRLLAELEQLEQKQRELDLRDQRAVDECLRKIEALRRKIDALNLGRDVEARSRRLSV